MSEVGEIINTSTPMCVDAINIIIGYIGTTMNLIGTTKLVERHIGSHCTLSICKNNILMVKNGNAIFFYDLFDSSLKGAYELQLISMYNNNCALYFQNRYIAIKNKFDMYLFDLNRRVTRRYGNVYIKPYSKYSSLGDCTDFCITPNEKYFCSFRRSGSWESDTISIVKTKCCDKIVHGQGKFVEFVIPETPVQIHCDNDIVYTVDIRNFIYLRTFSGECISMIQSPSQVCSIYSYCRRPLIYQNTGYGICTLMNKDDILFASSYDEQIIGICDNVIYQINYTNNDISRYEIY